jgi:hypothetical protein
MPRRRIAIGRAAQRLAVDGHHPIECANDSAHPTPEDRFELLRVEHAEHAQKRVLRGNAVLEHEKAPQPVGLEPAPKGDILEAVGVREHGAHRNHQDLPEVVAGPVARLTRIFKLTEFLHQTDSRSTHFRRPKDESRRAFERVHKMAA